MRIAVSSHNHSDIREVGHQVHVAEQDNTCNCHA